MLAPDDLEPSEFKLASVEDYELLIGAEAVDRILKKAERLHDIHVVNINSTYYGGGVAELLSSLTLLMNGSGIRTGWRVIQGRPDFFSVTKKMHNALQGDDINLTDLKTQIYEEVAFENAARLHLDHDIVIVHDPQPLPLIRHFRKKAPWVWQCHVDLSQPNADLWNYLAPLVERYDAVVMSMPEYAQSLSAPQRFIMPAINPYSTTNRDLSDVEIDERLAHYDIPTDLPLVVQVSRFDTWKDPQGVIDAFKIARKEVDCTLVLVGNVATDDPGRPGGVFQDLQQRRGAHPHPVGAGHRPGQRLAEAGRGGLAEIAAGRLRPDCHGSDVERRYRHRRQCRRHQAPDRGRRERLPGRQCRGSRRPYR